MSKEQARAKSLFFLGVLVDFRNTRGHNRHMGQGWGSVLLAGAVFTSTLAHAQNNDLIGLPRFTPPPQNVEEVKIPQMGGNLSLAVTVNALTPFGTPYSNGTLGFRYQLPMAIGMEVGFGITRQIEVLVSAAYEVYETQLNQPGPGGEPRFQIAKATQFPLMVIGRYAFEADKWMPDIEAGFGMGFGSVDYSEDFNAAFSANRKISTFRGHALFNAGFPWDNGFSLHVAAGVAFWTLPNELIPSTIGTIEQSSAMFGPYFKAKIRYQF